MVWLLRGTFLPRVLERRLIAACSGRLVSCRSSHARSAPLATVGPEKGGHLLGNAGDRPFQFGESERQTIKQMKDDDHLPSSFASETMEHRIPKRSNEAHGRVAKRLVVIDNCDHTLWCMAARASSTCRSSSNGRPCCAPVWLEIATAAASVRKPTCSGRRRSRRKLGAVRHVPEVLPHYVAIFKGGLKL
jgi:hypothetical protein